MTRTIRFALAAAALGLLAVATAQAATLPKLVGTDGPGFTISMKKAGKKVTMLKAGRYSITVKDLSSSHNFHLTGPGVNRKTSVAATVTRTWTVTFQKGKTYRFVCDPHASGMKGSFKTT